MCACVDGWVGGCRRGGKGHSILTSHYVRFFLIHSTLPTRVFVYVFLPLARAPTPCTKGEDYKSGKTKLITHGISTSQSRLKCNYMGLELWPRPAEAAKLPLADSAQSHDCLFKRWRKTEWPALVKEMQVMSQSPCEIEFEKWKFRTAVGSSSGTDSCWFSFLILCNEWMERKQSCLAFVFFFFIFNKDLSK